MIEQKHTSDPFHLSCFIDAFVGVLCLGWLGTEWAVVGALGGPIIGHRVRYKTWRSAYIDEKVTNVLRGHDSHSRAEQYRLAVAFAAVTCGMTFFFCLLVWFAILRSFFGASTESLWVILFRVTTSLYLCVCLARSFCYLILYEVKWLIAPKGEKGYRLSEKVVMSFSTYNLYDRTINSYPVLWFVRLCVSAVWVSGKTFLQAIWVAVHDAVVCSITLILLIGALFLKGLAFFWKSQGCWLRDTAENTYSCLIKVSGRLQKYNIDVFHEPPLV